jgi:hypothetical protein
MDIRFRTLYWVVLSLILLLLTILWLRARTPGLTLEGIWIGPFPPEICSTLSSGYLQLRPDETMLAQAGDVGCMGRYRIDRTAPYTLLTNPTWDTPTSFTYTLSNGVLTLQSTTGMTYTFTPCLTADLEPCTEISPF